PSIYLCIYLFALISADCAACDQPLHSGQVLLALGLSWHVYCFKC
ncbi:unnamed protein product, partial [Strongylus vulgaris]